MRPSSNARSYWDRVASKYDSSMRIFGAPLGRAIELTCSGVRGAERVLELAAGTGLFSLAVAREVGALTSTDYSPEMVRELSRRCAVAGVRNVECRQLDVYALDGASDLRAFDVVLAANVLHLLPDLPRALEAMRKALRPGGALIVPTFCHDQNLVSTVVSRLLALTGFPGERRFTLETLAASVESAGFRVETTQLIPGLLPIGFVQAQVPAVLQH